jgi:ABC-type amino acid transport substrate-binding protein
MQYAGVVLPQGKRAWITALAIASFALVSPALAQKPAPAAKAPSLAGTLDRVRQSAKIRLGYRTDARPFSYKDESGQPAGYSVALCTEVANAVKSELGLPTLNLEWVPVTVEGRFASLQHGEIDLLCGADARTLGRMKEVAFSIPIFPGGIGALTRADAPRRLQDVLSGQKPPTQPNWRASSIQLLQTQIFSVIPGTTTESWLNGKITEFQLTAKVVPVTTYDEGIQQLLQRTANVFFGDRAILLDAAMRSRKANDLHLVDRLFTYEPVALAFARGDADLRLIVDRTLSRRYASADFKTFYGKYFGAADDNTIAFFRWNTIPD